jgi:hypothetical protein
MHPLMHLENESKSCAIEWNFFLPQPLHEAIIISEELPPTDHLRKERQWELIQKSHQIEMLHLKSDL